MEKIIKKKLTANNDSPKSVLKIVLPGLLLILLVGWLASSFSLTIPTGKSAKKILGPEEAMAAAENFINNNLLPANTKATVKSAILEGNIYNISLNVSGEDYTSYMTQDGGKFFQSGINIATFAEEKAGQASAPAGDTQAAPPTNAPKSDKPSVELYVFTYCPYGTQAEKGIIPAVKLLGDKIDFKIRQIGAMHGEYEKIEAQRQLCIEKQYPTKFLDYTLAFAQDSGIGACGSNAQCSEPLVNALYANLGITKSTIDACMKTDGAALYATEEANSQSKSIGGSPTLVINGAQSSAGRDAASYLAGICAAFNTPPAECSQQLSSASPAPGFGQ